MSLITVVYHPEMADDLAAAMEAAGVPGRLVPCATDEALATEMAHADVLVATHCNLEAVVGRPRLQWIQSLASGIEDWFAPPGPPACPITRMTGVYERYMAEYVMAHILARTQCVAELRARQDRREWEPLQTTSLSGKLLGVAGTGHVGSMVAARASGFDMRVYGLRRGANAGRPGEHFDRVFDLAQKSDFLRELDYLVLALPLTPETAELVDAATLAMLPSRAILVNICRGGVVDEAALTAALSSGMLAGAILDTFASEPLDRESPLWTMENVTVTPHMAGAVHAWELGPICARNLREFASGNIPTPVVDLSLGY
jgi:phosphoglycerate dehydrogenase-like enzyme